MKTNFTRLSESERGRIINMHKQLLFENNNLKTYQERVEFEGLVPDGTNNKPFVDSNILQYETSVKQSLNGIQNDIPWLTKNQGDMNKVKPYFQRIMKYLKVIEDIAINTSKTYALDTDDPDNPVVVKANKRLMDMYLEMNKGNILGGPNGLLSTKLVPIQNAIKYIRSISKGTIHTVKAGESISMIARTYKTTVARIRTWNNLADNKLPKGTQLYVSQPQQVALPELDMYEDYTTRFIKNIRLYLLDESNPPVQNVIAAPSKNVSGGKTKTDSKNQNLIAKTPKKYYTPPSDVELDAYLNS